MMCHGSVIDQDGAMFACKYAHDDLKCPQCNGLFCGRHFDIEKMECIDCLDRESVLKENY